MEVLREFEGCVRKIRHRREQLKQKVEREAASMMELSEQHRLRRQHKRKRDRLKDRARVLRRLVEERRRENERERERIEGAREALGRSRRRDEDLFRGEGDAAAATSPTVARSWHAARWRAPFADRAPGARRGLGDGRGASARWQPPSRPK